MDSTPVTRESAPLDPTRHRGLFIGLLLLLAWAPIPIGSNREWSMALLVAGALSVSGGWLLSYAWRPFGVPDAVRSVRGPLLLLAAWAAYPLIQLVPLPVGIAEFAGGEVHGLYGQLPMERPDDYASFSIDRGVTYSGFLRQCGLIALFASVLVLVTSTMRLRTLMILILLVGFVEALYGLVLFLAGDELALWSPGQAMGTVSGTYVNQNHFAGLMELAIPVGFGLLLSGQPVGGAASGTRNYTHLLSGFLLGYRGVVLFCIFIMAAALILTTSRGGTGSLAIGIAVAIAIASSKRGVRARELRVGMMTVALVMIAIFWLGSGQFSEKLESEGFSSNRAEQRELSYRIIADSPLVGTGVGTYRWIFPTYKDERFGAYFYEHAHNDFLEILTEQGIIGFSLLATAIIFIFVRVVRAFVHRHDPLMRGALLATIAGCVSLLVAGETLGSLAIGIAVAIAIASSKRGVRARELRVGMMTVALVMIAIFWLGSGQFSEKLESEGFSSNRAEQRELSYRIIADSPLVGTGVGTYRWIFPTYKDERFGAYFYEHAHNDFLEILTEQGIIGFSLLATAIIFIFVRVVRAFVHRHDPLMRGALLATIAGCVSLLVHGLVDFNLQIPANASYFFVLLGIGVVASDLRSQRKTRHTGLRHARPD